MDVHDGVYGQRGEPYSGCWHASRQLAVRYLFQAVGGVYAGTHGSASVGRAQRAAGDLFRGSGFYEYYQVSQADEDNGGEELEPIEGGVKGHVEGLHSPFGLIWQVATQTGWPLKKILDTNYQCLVMMAADAPRYVMGDKKNYVEIKSEDELQAMLGKKYT